jgi:hypothetical protein
MDKIEALLEIKRQLDLVELDNQDLANFVKPLLVEVRKYGFTSFRISIPFPSFNDGDPCEPYVSEYVGFGTPLGDVREEYVGDWLACFEGLKTGGKCQGDALNPTDLEAQMIQIYQTFESLLDLGKSPSAVNLTFTLEGDSVTVDEEENVY